MTDKFWCAFNREGMAITSTLMRAASRSDAEVAIFQKFAHSRGKMESLGVHVAPAVSVIDVVKDNAR